MAQQADDDSSSLTSSEMKWAYNYYSWLVCEGQLAVLEINKKLNRHKTAYKRLLTFYNELATKLEDEGLDNDEKAELNAVIFLKNKYLGLILCERDQKQSKKEDLQMWEEDLRLYKLLQEGWKVVYDSDDDRRIYYKIKQE